MTPVTHPVVTPGLELTAYDVVVSAESMKPMALLLRDPNPLHLDARVVRDLGLGDAVINQGPLNASYVWEMLTRWSGGGRVTELELRFVANAYAGDRLQASGRVTEVDQLGRTVGCEVWLCRQDGSDVVRGNAVVVLPADRHRTDEEQS